MSYLSTITSALGTGVQMYGNYTAGKASKLAYDTNASQTEYQGEQKVKAIGEQETEMSGKQQAAYARAGVMNSGSALDVELHSATNFEYDKLVAKYNADSAASAARYKGRMAMLGAIGDMAQDLTKWGVNNMSQYKKPGDTQKVPTYNGGQDNPTDYETSMG